MNEKDCKKARCTVKTRKMIRIVELQVPSLIIYLDCFTKMMCLRRRFSPTGPRGLLEDMSSTSAAWSSEGDTYMGQDSNTAPLKEDGE